MAACGGSNSEIQFDEFMKAYDTISLRREQLINTVENTKIHIEDSFNDILQALQCRKMQLLRQVEVFTSQQMCAFKSRLAELVLMLVGLKMDSADSCHSLKDILKEEISNILGQSQASDQLQVKINSNAVKLAIDKWGEINTNKLWLKSQDQTASCLPKNLEEYDDGESHVFYKSISNEAHVTINIPQLWDQEADYWLHRETKHNPDNLESSCDVKNWLSLIESEHEPEIMCGPEFPSLFSGSEGSSSSIEVIQWDDGLGETHKLPKGESMDDYNKMKNSGDMTMWLAQSQSNCRTNLSNSQKDLTETVQSQVWNKCYIANAQTSTHEDVGQGIYWLRRPGRTDHASQFLDEEVRLSFAHYFNTSMRDWQVHK